MNKTTTDLVITSLDAYKHINPDAHIIVEVPGKTVEFRIGDALIYEDGYGRIVLDAE